eukprot:715961-Pyramimonas_sp.AAC.1
MASQRVEGVSVSSHARNSTSQVCEPIWVDLSGCLAAVVIACSHGMAAKGGFSSSWTAACR